MKKSMIVIFKLIFILQFLIMVSAGDVCNLDAILLSQDPYPAIPGEQVKLVFQISGLEGSDCGDTSISIQETFPFNVAPEPNPIFSVKAGTYVKDFSSFVLVPFKVNIDSDAFEGESQLNLLMNYNKIDIIEKFNIEIVDVRTDFEISVKNYDKTTQTLTFEILNIGEHDVEALTIDIPKQEGIEVRGSPRKIIGSLDSNDDTTFDFEATPINGDIRLILTYTDEINERRVLEKIVSFNMEYFNGRTTEEGRSIWFYITLTIVIIYLIYWYRNRIAQKRKRESH